MWKEFRSRDGKKNGWESNDKMSLLTVTDDRGKKREKLYEKFHAVVDVEHLRAKT